MKKLLLKERFQQLAGIKSLYELQKGDANNDGTVDQADVDWVNNNWLQPGDVYDSDDGIVNLADMTLVINNFGQGSSGGSGGCDTDCPKSQQARDLFNNNVSNPGNVLPSGFTNKMDNMGCTPLNNRLQSLTSKLSSKQTPDPINTGSNSYLAFCCGENPMHQAQIMLKMQYIQNILQNQTCA